jgi:hypothetical protein
MDRLSRMPAGAAIVVGAVIGLAIGLVVSLATDVPLAPEVGRCLVGWSAGSRAGIVGEALEAVGAAGVARQSRFPSVIAVDLEGRDLNRSRGTSLPQPTLIPGARRRLQSVCNRGTETVETPAFAGAPECTQGGSNSAETGDGVCRVPRRLGFAGASRPRQGRS